MNYEIEFTFNLQINKKNFKGKICAKGMGWFFLIPVLSRLFQIHYKSDSFSKGRVVIKL